MTKSEKNTNTVRPPVVVIVGHIDHGKSTLLDYIRKTNIVDGEAGGITQHLSAYEVVHKDENGDDRAITFIDTPGHEAFSDMRNRGAKVADIAILIVSAEDSVKTQTIEALSSIKASGVPFIVAVNKIDKPGANLEKVKIDLAEAEVYVEGYGGTVPIVPISAKTGDGVPELLDMIVLVADLSELVGDPNINAEGIVIESNRDPKRGITATLLIKNGVLKKGKFIVSGKTIVPTRMIEDFKGKAIEKASYSSPVRVIGFDTMPVAGDFFSLYDSKKEAEEAVRKNIESLDANTSFEIYEEGVAIIPIIVKTDVLGTKDAVIKEIKKLDEDLVKFKIIESGVGMISENDMKMAVSDSNVIVIGFNVKLDTRAEDIKQKNNIKVETFDIIYKISEFLETIKNERRPVNEVEEVIGTLKVIKIFSKTKDKQVLGCKVTLGSIKDGATLKIIRREFEIGKARVVGIEQSKVQAKEVIEGLECGVLVESKLEIAPGDTLSAILIVKK